MWLLPFIPVTLMFHIQTSVPDLLATRRVYVPFRSAMYCDLKHQPHKSVELESSQPSLLQSSSSASLLNLSSRNVQYGTGRMLNEYARKYFDRLLNNADNLMSAGTYRLEYI